MHPKATMTTLHLYLDDERSPKTKRPWVVVRSHDELVAAVEEHGFPGVISLDHDLGLDTPSGHDCAKWLARRGMELGIDPHGIEWNVHSANPVGAENIRAVYRSWCKVWRMEHG